MPAENETYVNRDSLPIAERAELFIREVAFKKYTKNLKIFQDKVASEQIHIEGLPEPMGTPDNPLDKEMLFSELEGNLRLCGYDQSEINKIRSVYVYADNKFESTPDRQKRKSGDATITHSLWMANFLAVNGITDPEVQMATILHDVHEDTGTTLEEIAELTSNKTAKLVDIVSKIKTERLFGDKVTLQKIKDRDEKATLEKILEAIDKDPRAILIKAADVIHNQATSDYIKNEIRIGKGNLALNFYEPMLRSLGFTYFADMIGDHALRSVRRGRFDEIEEKRNEYFAIMEPFYRDIINGLSENASYDGTTLNHNVISLEIPSIYQIYEKAEGKEAKSEDYMPYIHIVIDNEIDLLLWHRYFNQQGSKTPISDVDISLNSGNPVFEIVEFKDKDQIFKIHFKLSTVANTIKPSDLFTDSISLTKDEELMAMKKFFPIMNSYKLALSDNKIDGNVAEEMVEGAKRGLINVFDKDGNLQTVPSGSTVLDFAYRMGKNLGNDSQGVVIYIKDNGGWTIDPDAKLDTTLKEGMKIELITGKNSIVLPDRYDIITTQKAVKNIQEKTARQIGRWMKRNNQSTEAVDKVQISLSEGRIIPKIGEGVGVDYSLLQQKKEGGVKMNTMENFIQNARDRGVKIISEVYRSIRGKNLDSHIINVFSGQFEKDFGSFDDFLVNIGLTALPLREGKYLDSWIKDENPKYQTVAYTRNAVRDLINNRDSQWVSEVNISDQKGVLETLGKIFSEQGVDIQVRTTPDNYSYGRKTTIELRYVEGNLIDVQDISKELKRIYGENIVILNIKKQKE